MLTEKEPIVLETFEGHIILLCKNWYNVEGVDTLDGLRRLWCVRCGIPSSINKELDEYIANALYKLILKVTPDKQVYMHELVHKSLSNREAWRYPEGYTALDKMLWQYRSVLHDLQIKEDKENGKGLYELISLPKAQKRIIRRIVRGNAKYGDYGKLKQADKRS